MLVYKFGGGVLRDPEGIRQLLPVLEKEKQNMVVVVSAFGKTTNALEILAEQYFKRTGKAGDLLNGIRSAHLELMHPLFPDRTHPVYKQVNNLFGRMELIIDEPPRGEFDRTYDQIVSFGELVSSRVVSAWLNDNGVGNEWQDIRECLLTDDCFRDGKIDWEVSEERVKNTFRFDGAKMYVTQGFIGATDDGLSVTLGREGSDYTAAVLASMLDAEKVVIWKDVPGVLNADPKWMDTGEKLEEISYLEAVELSYYGAQVIHPKTIKPLENKKVPLYVKPFLDPAAPGTLIREINRKMELLPVYIRKENQVLITVLPRDYSFVVEESLGKIFSLFNHYRLRVNLVQSSAISISLCADARPGKLEKVLEGLEAEFNVKYNTGLELITIRHYTPEAIARVLNGKTVMIEQRTRNTVHFVLKPEDA